jgi:glycerol-3-phosphate cytidylyltransferase
MKIIITYGTFDILHVGHINLLKRAKALGDKLIVAISSDKFNEEKHKSALLNYDNRKAVLESIRYVDMVIPETNWEQKMTDVDKYNVDIFVMGDDWRGKFDFLKQKCEVVYLSRTQGISTTRIKNELFD